jgi:alpha-glucosidase
MPLARAAETLTLTSPNQQLTVTIANNEQGRLCFALRQAGGSVIEPSALGVTVQGQDLGISNRLGEIQWREVNERYPCRGVKAQAVNHCLAYEVPMINTSGSNWTLEVRIFDDGAAYRYRVPGAGRRHISGEATSWRLPSAATAWIQTNIVNYEGNYHRRRVSDFSTKDSFGIGCPVTVELPQGGYALLTEAALYHYSGMHLRPAGNATLTAAFAGDPQGWEIEGPIVSPWRVTLVAADLNSLVNADVISNLGEAPDARLFPAGANTSWIKPGKGLITWAVFLNDGAQWYRQKWFVDMCAAMNCEYLLVDGGWRTEKWGFLKDGGDLWDRLRELCDYAAAKKVGIFVWNAYPEGRDDGPGLIDRQARAEFFQRCQAAGVKGVKIDFFDSERREVIEVYEDILKQTAERQLMVNFHGANKPTGESRTWPHAITREGIREQEYVLWEQLPLEHYSALPFTRMVAGPGDFLPGFVRPQYLKNTTAVFQLATAVIFTSPFICWPDHPEAYLESPFLGLVRNLPPAWDETRVLPGSAIGSCAAFARRAGTNWYVAVINSRPEEQTMSLSLEFLDDGDYQAALYRDVAGPNAAAQIETGLPARRDQRLSLRLKPGGGFVGWFHRPASYAK